MTRKIASIGSMFILGSLAVGMIFLLKPNSALAVPHQVETIGGVVINEIRTDQTGTDNDEYFELAGPANASLDGITYLVIGEGAGGSGVIEAVIDLTGNTIPSSGYFVVAENTFTLGTADLTASLNFENADNVTHLLVNGFSGANGNDLDTDDDGILDSTPWSAQLDLIAVILEQNPPTTTEFHYGPPTVGPDGSFAPGHVYLCGSDWLIGAFDPSGGQDTPGTANPCSSPQFDLVVSKSGEAYGFAGEPLVYMIEIQNSGVLTAANVIVTDTLPLNSTFAGAESGALTVTDLGDRVVFNYGELYAGAIEPIVLTVTVNSNVTQGTFLTNTVTASTDTAGDDQVNNTDEWSSEIYEIVPIAAARAGNDGDVFAVEGQIIYTPGTYNSSGWALQDASGGIAVFYNPPPTVARDDVVRLIATRGSFSNEEQFAAPVLYFNNFGPGAPVTPTIFSTSDLAAGLTEGWLAQIEGVISGLTACSGNYDFMVNDGTGPAMVFVDQDTLVDVCALGAQNGDPIRVTGFSTQFNADFEIKPRDSSDIALILNTPVIGKDAPLQVAPGELYTYTITIQNFLGYTLTNVVITDVVPADASFAYALDGGTEVGGVVTWNAGDLAHLGSVSARFAVTATTSTLTLIVNDDYGVVASNFATVTLGSPVATLVLEAIGPACGDPAVPISFIQGSGSNSPLVGADTAIEGVVVGDYQAPSSGYDGFFVQEEDADADVDPMTSEGIFVYDDAVDVQAGDVVRVFGTVAEFNGLTELNQVTSVQVCSSGANVTPASVTLPVDNLAEWEWYEGMLLSIPHPLYVTEIFHLGRYGEVSLSVNDRIDQPTQVTDPGASALALQDLNDRSRLQLNDGATGQNPDPIIYPSPELSATNTLRGGDMVAGLTGVLNYSFGTYLIEPVGPITFVHSNPRPTVPGPISGTLKVASFNVLNYFSTIDNGIPICGPLQDQDCRGADSAEEFTRQRDKIIHAILAIDADVYGLIELENHPDDEALDDLLNGLNVIAGAGTYAKINTGVIGSDAIKVALIYKTAMVTPVGSFAILDDTFDPNYHDDYNRPALAQTFQEMATSESLTVVVNHFKSKGSDCNALGDFDLGDGQGNCNLTRLDAAAVLLDWLAGDPTGSGDPDFLIIGDLNSYAMEDPIMALLAGGFTDVYGTLGSDNYSYVFDGQWGTLDYSLANNSLFPQVAGVTTWHINADEPIVLDYNVEFKTPHHVMSLYSDEPYRASDHDPVIVSFNLAEPVILDLNIYMPFMINNGTTGAVPLQPVVQVVSPGILLAFVGLSGFVLRRKR